MNARAPNPYAAVARQWLNEDPLILDTETTGLDRTAEMCEIAIIDRDGSTVLDTLVRPSRPIPPGASAIHHIGNADVANAPTFAEIIGELEPLLARPLVVYNADYDLRILHQSARARGLRLPTLNAHCAMKLYADYRGEWDSYHGHSRWHKLNAAAAQCGLPIPPNLHRARADTELTRQLLIYLAAVDS